MFIFDQPYISDVAKRFLEQSQSPLLANDFSKNEISGKANLISESSAIRQIERQKFRWIYSNSENAISWVTETFGKNSEWAQKIDLFKNKHRFRTATKNLFPDIRYQLISAEELEALSFDQMGGAFIIKPVIGFISAGVYRVNTPEEWDLVKKEIQPCTESAARAFPEAVLSSAAFLIESIVPGEEYAIDAYFDDRNKPVVLNILHHRFADERDMRDRLYITSPDLIRSRLPLIESFLERISGIGDFRGFPIHSEIRIDARGVVRPIEINPLRFAGWCTTDIAWYAWGINVYEYFAEKQKPDWETILKDKPSETVALAVIEQSKALPQGKTFDYEKLALEFSSIASLRRIDYRRFPLYAFVFFRVATETEPELARALALDPGQFISDELN